MRGQFLITAALGLGALPGCNESKPKRTPAGSRARSSAAASTTASSTRALTSASSSASTGPTPSGSGAPPEALDPRLFGHWKGSTTVYSKVVSGQQTYTRREMDVTISRAGRVRIEMRKGLSRGTDLGPPIQSCSASGELVPSVDQQLELRIAVSSCSAAKKGAQPRFKINWVGNCLTQWNTTAGPMPYEVDQITIRRSGCKR